MDMNKAVTNTVSFEGSEKIPKPPLGLPENPTTLRVLDGRLKAAKMYSLYNLGMCDHEPIVSHLATCIKYAT